MQNSTLILTEQRPSHDKSTTGAIIQQAITTWLTKELSQMIPALRFSGAGISNNFLPNSCSCATIQVSSYALKEV